MNVWELNRIVDLMTVVLSDLCCPPACLKLSMNRHMTIDCILTFKGISDNIVRLIRYTDGVMRAPASWKPSRYGWGLSEEKQKYPSSVRMNALCYPREAGGRLLLRVPWMEMFRTYINRLEQSDTQEQECAYCVINQWCSESMILECEPTILD